MQENPNFISENPANSAPKQQERATAFMLSIGLLIFVLLVTGVFFGLKIMKQSSIDVANSETQTINSKISALEADKKNSVAALIEGNSIPSIELSPLILQLQNLASQSQVQFNGFNIADDSITTTLTAVNADKDAVQKIINLMNTFAKNGQQGTFALEPILSISGNRMTRTTPVTFKIVPIKDENATENTNSDATVAE